MPDRLTVNEAAALVGLKSQIVWNGIHRKSLPVKPVTVDGRERVMVTREDLLAWAAAREQKLTQQWQAPAPQRSRRPRPPREPGQPRPGSKARCHRHCLEWAELLKKTRENQGLSISEVGRRADTCQSYVSRMEAFGEVPRREKVLAVARALGVDPNPFLVICGYAPEETEQLAQLVKLQPEEQRLALALLSAWREAPESARRQWLPKPDPALLAG